MFSFIPCFDEKRALSMCMEMIHLVDEVWVFGDYKRSEGCRMEINAATEWGIPVHYEYGRV
jgi:hypothetical protein